MSASVVAQVKQELLAAGHNCDGACGAFKITSTVAWRLRDQGWGLILSGGNGCNQTPTGENYRVDTVMQRSGSVVDMLGMAESNEGLVFPQVPHTSYNIPVWNPTGPQDPGNWRAPYDPGLITDTPGGPIDPGGPVTPGSSADIILAIKESEEKVKQHVTGQTERVLTTLSDMRQEIIEFAEKAEVVLKKLAILRREGGVIGPDEPDAPESLKSKKK